jgi:hypothetical protein
MRQRRRCVADRSDTRDPPRSDRGKHGHRPHSSMSLTAHDGTSVADARLVAEACPRLETASEAHPLRTSMRRMLTTRVCDIVTPSLVRLGRLYTFTECD